MKKIILSVLTLVFTQGAWADSALTPVMKSMGDQFKVIAIGLQTKNFGEVEMAAVEQLQRDSAAAALIYPETATTETLKLQYSVQMAELVQASLKLEDTVEIEAQVNPQVLAESFKVFSEINDIRKKGHAEFKAE